MKRICLLVLTCLFISIMSTQLLAFGIGGYFSGGGGERYWNKNITDYRNREKNYKIGGGLIIDSNMARQESFNYRLNAGYYKMNGDPRDLGLINTYHSFGYGLVKQEYVRLWFGPQIGIGYGYADYQNVTFIGLFARETIKYRGLNASLGLVLGLNINIGKYFSITLDGGGRYNALAGSTELSGIVFGGGSIIPILSDKSTFKLINHGPEGFANIGLMMRISDAYVN